MLLKYDGTKIQNLDVDIKYSNYNENMFKTIVTILSLINYACSIGGFYQSIVRSYDRTQCFIIPSLDVV